MKLVASVLKNVKQWQDQHIETANIQQATEQVTLKGIYDINGRQLPAMQKGLNVVKMSNGETRKVVVK